MKPVDHAIPWINNFVIFNKKQLDQHHKSQLYICLDPSNLNKAIAREPFYCTTPCDIFHSIKFLPLETSVRDTAILNLIKLVNFLSHLITPFGRFKFARMPFGLTVTGDAFQYKLDGVFFFF